MPETFALAGKVYARKVDADVVRPDLTDEVKAEAYRGFPDYMMGMLLVLQKVNYEPTSLDPDALKELCYSLFRDEGLVSSRKDTFFYYMAMILRGSDGEKGNSSPKNREQVRKRRLLQNHTTG